MTYVSVMAGTTTEPADLKELATGLRQLHHALLEEERAAYEQTHGPVAGGGQLLHLVAHDPHFAWLRVLSVLMVDIDTLLDEETPPTVEETGAIRRELEETLSPAAPPPFWDRLSALLQTPNVVIPYGRVRAAVTRLPALPPADAAAQLHAQHRWAVARRKRGLL
jgi:hypothetical protein